jgi:dienelactone hydrolase
MINNPISSVRARLARVILIGIFLASSNALAEPASEPITIWSDGVQLAGDLWKPEGLQVGEQRPALLMVHGWGGTKSHLNQAYAPRFAALGYIVLTFDYRGWGDSDGKLLRTGAKPQGDMEEYVLRVKEVRTIVDPIDQLEDIRNAYYYLIGEANVDPQRLAIWGSSLGGGLALQSAATLPGFQVLITQVGAVNPQAGLQDPQSPLNEQAMISWRSARARGEATPFPGPETTAEGLTGFPDWPEYVTYDPFASRNDLTAATLIIDAADEELFDIQRNGHALYEDIKDRLSARYEALPGKHYDIYRGESYQTALELETNWLREHLPL